MHNRERWLVLPRKLSSYWAALSIGGVDGENFNAEAGKSKSKAFSRL